MSSRLQLDDMRAAVAVERQEALRQLRKDDQVGAKIHAARPGNGGAGGVLELVLDRSLPEGMDKVVVAWNKEQTPAELISTRLADGGAPLIDVALATLPPPGG